MSIKFDKRFCYIGLFFNYWETDIDLPLSKGKATRKFAQCYFVIIPCFPITFNICYKEVPINDE